MKKYVLFAFIVFCFAGLQAQNNIELHIAPRLGNAVFALNAVVVTGNYEYKLTRLDYYISEIKIRHDGGQMTTVENTWLLVKPALDSVYQLGAFPGIQSVESVQFSIGVDPAHNHLDPSSYPSGHPLAPQDPSMHWGWTSGYRFIALEGVSGNAFVNNFEIHALDDVNYKTVSLNTGAEVHPNGDKTIHLVADYARLLDGIKVSGGLIVHGSTDEAAILVSNMQNSVFTPQSPSAVLDPAFEGTFLVSPNPAPSGTVQISMDLPAGFEYSITLSDLSGRIVLRKTIPAGAQAMQLEQVNAGVYLLHVWQNNRAVAVTKLVATE